MKHLLLLFLLVLPAGAANHLLTWSLNASNELVMGYNLYRQAGTPPAWVKIASVGAVNTVTVSNVASGWSIYALTATNLIGESAMSQPASAFVPIIPMPPTNILINLQTRVIDASSNLVASFSVGICATEPRAFFQGRMVATNLTLASGPALTGPWTPVAILPVPIESTRSRLFAGR